MPKASVQIDVPMLWLNACLGNCGLRFCLHLGRHCDACLHLLRHRHSSQLVFSVFKPNLKRIMSSLYEKQSSADISSLWFAIRICFSISWKWIWRLIEIWVNLSIEKYLEFYMLTVGWFNVDQWHSIWISRMAIALRDFY